MTLPLEAPVRESQGAVRAIDCRGRSWRILAFAAAIVLCAARIQAQPAIQEIRDQPWQLVSLLEDAGLGSVYIMGIDFAPDGTAWLATSIGLYRYDGYTWRRYTTRDGLPTDFVRSVLVTHAGDLWVGTSRGAGVFDGRRFDPRGADRELAGPSVRRIVEDPDGTLWFCSDRWPEPGVEGGLTSLRDGRWRRFTAADGIVEGYVQNYFRDSNGHQFVLAIDGVRERAGDRFVPLREPGFPTDPRPSWEMVELPSGALVVQQEGRVLTRRQGRWTALPRARGPMVVSRGGALVSALEDRARRTLVFQRWTGAGFVTASAEIDISDSPSEMTRQAPDGSVWCVGKGILVRWRYRAPTWTALGGLPAQQDADARGRVWFADDHAVWVVRGGGTPELLPGARGPLHIVDTGEVWAASDGGFLRLHGAAEDFVPHDTAGMTAIESIVSDARPGRLWFAGRGAAAEPVIRSFDGTTWRTPSPAIPDGFELTAIERDTDRGIWLTIHGVGTNRWDIARIEEDVLDRLPSDNQPPLQRPRIAVGPEGVHLYDYTGMYAAEDRSLAVWRKVDAPFATSASHFALPGMTWFIYEGVSQGRRGVAAYRQGRWHAVPVDWRGYPTRGPAQTLLLPAVGGFYIVRAGTEPEAAEFVAVPGTAAITRVAQDSDGDYWIATSAYVLRYRPDRTPLRATIVTTTAEVRADREFQAAFAARRRYEPRQAGERFEYSWRLDDGPWTHFASADTLRLAPSTNRPGTHRLQLRARDPSGATSAWPAALQFVVLPVPLQERAWFWPLFSALGLLLVYTTAVASSARTRLERLARRLEDKVRERTEELELDIVHRQRAEAALRESEQRFKGVFDSAFQEIGVLTPDGVVQEANQTALSLVGAERDDVVGRLLWDTPWWNHSPEVQQQLKDAVARAAIGALVRFEAEHRRRDGAVMTVDCSLKPVLDETGHVQFLITESRDITERKRAETDRATLETQLRQAQKMDAIGTLAGGVAHDFNNLLTPIFGNAEIASLELPADHPVQSRLSEVLQAAQRARDLVNQILTLSRRREQARAPLQLAPVVVDALKLMRASLPATIEIVSNTPADLPVVLADPGQIHQVVMNLCTNAAHAMPDDRGRLEVSLSLVHVDADFARVHPRLRVNPYVRLAVADTGSGIDAETLERIFEPFFSTKPTGKGTGLGLSVVHGIMEHHGGAITVYSQPGRGTTFHLYFPIADGAPIEPPAASAKAPRGSGEQILVVDDEAAVADIAVRMLQRAGYGADPYTDPVEALAAFTDEPDRFDLVLTDLTMPRLTGVDLARQLRRVRPDIRIVLGSGFSDDLGADRARQAGVSELIMKPYTIDDLAETIHRVLSA